MLDFADKHFSHNRSKVMIIASVGMAVLLQANPAPSAVVSVARPRRHRRRPGPRHRGHSSAPSTPVPPRRRRPGALPPRPLQQRHDHARAATSPSSSKQAHPASAPRSSTPTRDTSRPTAPSNPACASRWHHALIVGRNVEDVAIVGAGTIDGNQVFDPRGEEKMRGPHTILLGESRGLTIRGLTIRDSANYAVMLEDCSDVRVEEVDHPGRLGRHPLPRLARSPVPRRHHRRLPLLHRRRRHRRPLLGAHPHHRLRHQLLLQRHPPDRPGHRA